MKFVSKFHGTARQSGRTTQQLKDAPKNCIYIIPSGAKLFYFTELAKQVNRTDVKIVTTDWLATSATYGVIKPVELDHACELKVANQITSYQMLKARFRRNNG